MYNVKQTSYDTVFPLLYFLLEIATSIMQQQSYGKKTLCWCTHIGVHKAGIFKSARRPCIEKTMNGGLSSLDVAFGNKRSLKVNGLFQHLHRE